MYFSLNTLLVIKIISVAICTSSSPCTKHLFAESTLNSTTVVLLYSKGSSYRSLLLHLSIEQVFNFWFMASDMKYTTKVHLYGYIQAG